MTSVMVARRIHHMDEISKEIKKNVDKEYIYMGIKITIFDFRFL